MDGSPDVTDQKKLFDLYQLYVDTTETVCARRAEMNKWMLTVNGAVTSLYGYLASDKSGVPAADQLGWLIAIPSAGVIICFAWAAMLASYRKLNAAKFGVIHELEAELPAAPFVREKEIYEKLGRRPLSQVERAVPYAFMTLYGAFIAFRVVAFWA